MQTDGQLYKVLHKGEREFPPAPPPGGPVPKNERPEDKSGMECAICPNASHLPRKQDKKSRSLLSGVGKDELLLLGIIFLIISDKNETDLPLVLALVYVLISE